MIKRLTKHLLVRYFISGSISATVNLALFFVLHHVYQVYYITSSIIAFIVAFLISLVLQKFWTFKDRSMDNIHRQIGKYLLTSLVGLLIDIIVLYVCVEYFRFYALIGQIVAGLLTACCTFFLSRHFVFKIDDKSDKIKIETEFKL